MERLVELKRLFSLLIIFTGLAALAGCAKASSPVSPVEKYYQAILQQNADQVKSITCASFQETALAELDSFQGVKTELQGFSCQASGTTVGAGAQDSAGKEGDSALVKCSGKIVATYGSEKMDFPLAERVHQVVNENGTWKLCGGF
jgi:hypothetical protein